MSSSKTHKAVSDVTSVSTLSSKNNSFKHTKLSLSTKRRPSYLPKPSPCPEKRESWRNLVHKSLINLEDHDAESDCQDDVSSSGKTLDTCSLTDTSSSSLQFRSPKSSGTRGINASVLSSSTPAPTYFYRIRNEVCSPLSPASTTTKSTTIRKKQGSGSRRSQLLLGLTGIANLPLINNEGTEDVDSISHSKISNPQRNYVKSQSDPPVLQQDSGAKHASVKRNLAGKDSSFITKETSTSAAHRKSVRLPINNLLKSERRNSKIQAVSTFPESLVRRSRHSKSSKSLSNHKSKRPPSQTRTGKGQEEEDHRIIVPASNLVGTLIEPRSDSNRVTSIDEHVTTKIDNSASGNAVGETLTRQSHSEAVAVAAPKDGGTAGSSTSSKSSSSYAIKGDQSLSTIDLLVGEARKVLPDDHNTTITEPASEDAIKLSSSLVDGENSKSDEHLLLSIKDASTYQLPLCAVEEQSILNKVSSRKSSGKKKGRKKKKAISFSGVVEAKYIPTLQDSEYDMFYNSDEIATFRNEKFLEDCGLNPAEFD